jgi:hypothetical protein
MIQGHKCSTAYVERRKRKVDSEDRKELSIFVYFLY